MENHSLTFPLSSKPIVAIGGLAPAPRLRKTSRVRRQSGSSWSGGEGKRIGGKRPRWAPGVGGGLCSSPCPPSCPLRARSRESWGRVASLLSFHCPFLRYLLGALYHFWDRREGELCNRLIKADQG